MSHVGLAPLQVVGYEGLLGTLVLFLVLMPIVYFIPGKDGQGLHEDSLETAYMVSGLLVCPVEALLHACLHLRRLRPALPASCVLGWPSGRQASNWASVQLRCSFEHGERAID